MKKYLPLLLLPFFFAFKNHPPVLPANDECTDAIVINGSAATTYTTTGATASYQAAHLPGNDDDVWFKFTATAAEAAFCKIQISNFTNTAAGGPALNAGIEVWDNCTGGVNIQSAQATGLYLRGLTAGTTYYVRVYTIETAVAANFNITVSPVSAPANDDCTSAVDITGPVATVFTTAGATTSAQTPYLPGTNDDDVWFKFTANSATAAGYIIALNNFADPGNAYFPPSAVMELWTGCAGGTNLQSVQGSSLVANALTNGSTYYVRVYTNGSVQFAKFNISATPFSAPDNDNCNTAIQLTPVVTCGTGQGPYTTLGAGMSGQPSGDATGKDDDVWFKFTTGTDNLYGKVSIINPVYTGFGSPVIELWTSCGATGYSKFFPLSTNANLGTLLPSTTYYVRVYTYGASTLLQSFNICVSLGQSPPANDTYFTAATLALHTDNTCTNAATGTTLGATTEPPNDCAGLTQPKDVWYKFVAVTTTAHIELNNVTLLPGHATTDAGLIMQLLDGSNTAPTLLCSTTGMVDFDGHNAATTLTIGHTYYLRVYNNTAGNACTFNICTKVPPPPAYNSCAKAANIAVSANEYCTAGLSVSNVNAVASSANGGCIGNVGSDIWLKFIAPATTDALSISIKDYVKVSGSEHPTMGIAVYNQCGTDVTMACKLGTNLVLPALTAGNVYYIRIIAFNAPDQGNFTVCVHHSTANAANVSCPTASTIHASADASAAYITGTTVGTIANNNLTDCFDNKFVFSNAVWFKFTAAAATQLIDIQDVTGATNNPNVQVGYKFYIGSGADGCATSTSAFACTSDVVHDNPVLSSLVPGGTYLIQVMTNQYNGDNAVFKIRAIGAQAPPNDDESGVITLVENPVYKASAATAGTFLFSTLSPTPANPAYGGDVWYRFVAAATTATIRIDNISNAQIVIPGVAGITTPTATGYSVALTGLSLHTGYYIRLYNTSTVSPPVSPAKFYISVYGAPSTAAADVPTPGAACETVDGPVVSTNSNTWLHITEHGKMVASIFDGNTGVGGGLGNITASYYLNSGTVRQTPGGTPYLDRNYGIVPQNEPAPGHPLRVIFYFTRAEFNALTNADNSDVHYLNDLVISAFASQSCTNIFGNSGETNYPIVDFGMLSADVYYAEVDLPHLSGFYFKSSTGVVLPVICNSFNYSVQPTQVKLSWQTGAETNSSYFDVQRSNNGFNFNTIGTVAAVGNSTTTRYYYYADATAKTTGTYYYRLKQFDKDGKGRFTCSVLKVATSNAGELFGKAYPNPAVDNVSVNLQQAYIGKVGVQVLNMLGQVVSQKNIEVNNNITQINISTGMLPAGAYTIRLVARETVYTKQFSKVK